MTRGVDVFSACQFEIFVRVFGNVGTCKRTNSTNSRAVKLVLKIKKQKTNTLFADKYFPHTKTKTSGDTCLKKLF